MQKLKFPKNFYWGAATSSHQVEGGNQNDWTIWEKRNKVRNQDKSGKAADHWNLWKKDYDLLEEMNLNFYRFSIEWSRVEPEQGKFDYSAIDQYKDMVKSLKKRGIEPMVTLHHFTNPIWLDNWTNKENIDAFLKFAQVMVNELKNDVKYWCTINEPNIFSTLSYGIGIWPPGEKSNLKIFRVVNNLISAHNKSYKLINQIYAKNNLKQPQISMAFNMQYYEAADKNPLSLITAKFEHFTANLYTFSRVRKNIDYIGLNYYFSHLIKGFKKQKSPIFKGQISPPLKNDLNWDVYAKGLYYILKNLKKYKLPIIITEAGIADEKDNIRPKYLQEQLYWVHKAIKEDVDVIGYSHWSLIDNFEWQEGYAGKFGLVAVDFKSQKRTRRKSAKLYSEIAKNNYIKIKKGQTY